MEANFAYDHYCMNAGLPVNYKSTESNMDLLMQIEVMEVSMGYVESLVRHMNTCNFTGKMKNI